MHHFFNAKFHQITTNPFPSSFIATINSIEMTSQKASLRFRSNNFNSFHQKWKNRLPNAKINCIFTFFLLPCRQTHFWKISFYSGFRSTERTRSRRRENIIHIRKFFRLSSFAGACLALLLCCQELCEKISKTLGAASNYWQSTRSHCVTVPAKKCVRRREIFFDYRYDRHNVPSNHLAWIFFL